MNNIILVGMPGSGKSTLGVVLARRLGYGFMDTDSLISCREKKTLQEIIDEKGIEEFKKTESETGENIVCDRVIIATGGSMIMAPGAMEHLKELGCVVYINVPLRELKKRLGNFNTRGIIMNGGETLEDVLRRRSPLYEKYADITVNYKKGDSLEKTVDRIVEKLRMKSVERYE